MAASWAFMLPAVPLMAMSDALVRIVSTTISLSYCVSPLW